MPRRRHTPQQIVRKLREADKLFNEGQDHPMGLEPRTSAGSKARHRLPEVAAKPPADGGRLEEVKKIVPNNPSPASSGSNQIDRNRLGSVVHSCTAGHGDLHAICMLMTSVIGLDRQSVR